MPGIKTKRELTHNGQQEILKQVEETRAHTSSRAHENIRVIRVKTELYRVVPSLKSL